MKLLEKHIQDQIMQYLQMKRGVFAWRQNAGSVFMDSPTGRHGFRSASVDGIADIIGIINGKPLAIEVKRPGNKPTEKQLDFLIEFASAGGVAIVADDLDQVKTTIAKVENAQKNMTGDFSYFKNWTLKVKVPQKRTVISTKTPILPNIAIEEGDRQ